MLVTAYEEGNFCLKFDHNHALGEATLFQTKHLVLSQAIKYVSA